MKFTENQITGRLEIQDVFVYYDGPRLFSCLNDAEQVFMVIFAGDEDDHSKWLIGKVSRAEYGKLLDGELDIRNAFLSSACLHLLKHRESADDVSYIRAADIESDVLPAVGVKLEIRAQTKDLEYRVIKRNVVASGTIQYNQILPYSPLDYVRDYVWNLNVRPA